MSRRLHARSCRPQCPMEKTKTTFRCRRRLPRRHPIARRRQRVAFRCAARASAAARAVAPAAPVRAGLPRSPRLAWWKSIPTSGHAAIWCLPNPRRVSRAQRPPRRDPAKSEASVASVASVAVVAVVAAVEVAGIAGPALRTASAPSAANAADEAAVVDAAGGGGDPAGLNRRLLRCRLPARVRWRIKHLLRRLRNVQLLHRLQRRLAPTRASRSGRG